jgi:hypothetical protein
MKKDENRSETLVVKLFNIKNRKKKGSLCLILGGAK